MMVTRRFRRALQPNSVELLTLVERAVDLEIVRLAFALVLLASVLAMPSLLGTSAVTFVLGTLVYLAVAATPMLLRRLGRQVVLPFLKGMLLVDGIFLAWVMVVTGGVQSPLRFLVSVHLVSVTLLFSYRTGLKIALWHSLLYLTLFDAQVTGWVTVGGASSVLARGDGVQLGHIVTFNMVAFWLVALAAAALSALNERELRSQKVDLQRMSETISRIEATDEPAGIAAILLDQLCTTFGFSRGAVLASPTDDLELLASTGEIAAGPLRPGLDRLAEQAWTTQDVTLARTLDPESDPRLAALFPESRNVLLVPLHLDRGQRLGILALENGSGDRIKAWVVDMVRQFAAHAALALHSRWLAARVNRNLDEIRELKDELQRQNVSLEARVAEQTKELLLTVEELREVDEQRRRLLSNMVRAQEEERQRLAGEVHDDPVQKMVAVSMRLQILRRSLSDPESITVLDRLMESVRSSIRSMRQLLFELRPPILDEQGIGAAIDEYLSERNPDFLYDVDDRLTGQPPEETRIVLYRIAQEALANAYKHSRAERVHVRLEERDGGVEVEVGDDGVGFAPQSTLSSRPGHLGLGSMRERAELAGGRCDIHSLPGGGTTVLFWLPGPPEQAAPAPPAAPFQEQAPARSTTRLAG